jgi:peptide/nickel transport system substrate-binding protein
MKHYLRIAAVVTVLAVVAAACGGGSDEPSGSSSSSGTAAPTGGTLKAVMTQDFFHGLDPTAEYYSVSWEFLRCCMARTLLSYTAKPADEGGGTPIPDLATDLPVVSEDQLTYTFTLKDGVMFGDPLNRPIVAQDFVNAINRLSDPKVNTTGYPFYYTDIKGFSDAAGGQVEGITAPDEKTVMVELSAPNPDIPFLFTMPATAPIPTELIDAHYDAVELGQFLVSSGPYQWEGMEGLDLTGKTPPSGMDIGKSYVLVRNPQWDPATDEVRKAYLDSIEIQVGGEVQDLLDKVNAGAVDWCIDCGATAATLQVYQGDPALQDRLQIHPSDALAYTGLNVFEPPMDDVHVRKALNWALDKDAMWRLAGGPPAGTVAGHFIPPGMMGGLNADYNPYSTPDNAGDPEAAKAEMAQSKYDENGDGVCDADACTVTALAVTNDNDAIKALEIMDKSFEPIGINLDIKTLNYNALVTKCSTLEAHTAFCQAGWGKDYPSPYTFFGPLLDGGENGSNYSFMGATDADLKAQGYSGYEVDDAGLGLPNITADIVACRETPVGSEQDQCWADLDKKVMEELVPVIPRRFPNDVDVLGSRIVAYSYDQFSGVGAPDQMAVSG